jgi:hypothetical protein
LLLQALQKARSWPSWKSLQDLMRQYGVAAAAAAVSRQGREAGRGEQQQALQGQLVKSLPATVAAVGRLMDLRCRLMQRRLCKQQQQQLQGQQQQQQLVDGWHQELLQHNMLWHSLQAVLGAAVPVLQGLDPVQLAQLLSGVEKAVESSQAAAMSAASAASTSAAAARNPALAGQSIAAIDASLAAALGQLQQQLAGPVLQQLLQQHVAAVAALLPVMPLQQRLSVARSYRQLGVSQLPRPLQLTFDRDASVAASGAVAAANTTAKAG